VEAPRVFVVGDAASVVQNEHPVPGVAQAAIQEGRYVGRLIAKELKGQKVVHPFSYFDKGNMAVVGKNYAVLERGRLHTSGLLTWLVWAFVHILSLPLLQNRLRVQRQWLWSYFTGQRSSRLIPELPR
jgi:NADH:quinone reductase (non-electrogenic)